MTNEVPQKSVDVAVVMPVYNEEDCIGEVISDWLKVLASAGAVFRLIVVNDGSKDGTRARIDEFTRDARVVIVHKSNEGHGPSILRGYAMAADMAQWVFQVDSDNEIPASAFSALWDQRDSQGFLFGIRTGRRQVPLRALISRLSRVVVGLWCGRAVRDVNVPFRLMRSELLKPMLVMIPPDTFAPNLAISGLAARLGHRITNIPVPYQGRKTGSVSLFGGRLVRMLARSLFETTRILAGCRKG